MKIREIYYYTGMADELRDDWVDYPEPEDEDDQDAGWEDDRYDHLLSQDRRFRDSLH